jgi:hypothetical protein
VTSQLKFDKQNYSSRHQRQVGLNGQTLGTYSLWKSTDYPEVFVLFLSPSIQNWYGIQNRHAVAQWLTHYATSRKVAGSRPDEVNELSFNLPNPSSTTWPREFTQPLT